jgi:hypothetical protein
MFPGAGPVGGYSAVNSNSPEAIDFMISEISSLAICW